MGIPLKSKFYLIFDTFTPSHFILHKTFDQIFRQINMDAMNFYELCLCFFFDRWHILSAMKFVLDSIVEYFLLTASTFYPKMID